MCLEHTICIASGNRPDGADAGTHVTPGVRQTPSGKPNSKRQDRRSQPAETARPCSLSIRVIRCPHDMQSMRICRAGKLITNAARTQERPRQPGFDRDGNTSCPLSSQLGPSKSGYLDPASLRLRLLARSNHIIGREQGSYFRPLT